MQVEQLQELQTKSYMNSHLLMNPNDHSKSKSKSKSKDSKKSSNRQTPPKI